LGADKHFDRLTKGMMQMDILSVMGLVTILSPTTSSASVMGIFLNVMVNFRNILL